MNCPKCGATSKYSRTGFKVRKILIAGLKWWECRRCGPIRRIFPR